MKTLRAAACVFLTLWWLTACGGSTPDENVEAADLPQRVMPSASNEKLCNQLYGKNKTGKRISWKGHVPVLFSFDASFPPEYVTAVKSAMDTWNKAAGFELFRTEANPRANSAPANDGRNTIYFLTNDERGSALRGIVGPKFREDGGVAVTVIRGRANQIVDTDIIFDGVANTFSTSRVHFNSFDVESIALHELGHSLGLVHSNDLTSTMFYGESPLSLSFRVLDATTVQMLDCEYK